MVASYRGQKCPALSPMVLQLHGRKLPQQTEWDQEDGNRPELCTLRRSNNCVSPWCALNTLTRGNSRIPSGNARLVPFLSTWLKGLRASEGQKICSQALRILPLWNSTFQCNSNISSSFLAYYSLASLEPGGESTWRETIVFPSEVANPFSF